MILLLNGASFGSELDLLHIILLLLLYGGAGGVNNAKNVDNCKRKAE